MVIKNISFIYMYEPLLIYVSVSLISQWGLTAHDIPPQREDRKLDILENISFLSAKQKHAVERRIHYNIYTKCSHWPAESIRVGFKADGVSESGIRLRTSS